MNGDMTGDYKKTNVDDFINVLDYKFLRVVDKWEEPNGLIVDEDMYKMYQEKEFTSFREWKESLKRQFTDLNVVSESEQDMVMKSATDKHYKIELLYDVNATNGLGLSIYK
ncbi:hypothetical protein P4H61_09515 [Paenibacillus peoriae]|uniref:hypothetical protein n=1 Tax=Paenibacillus peoriae TaxID=59893 RepID=UPI00026C5BB7|nr:hypothetical protein [Paenibacillus peoriae]MEC0181738.1 hypothetical protein [Paenibacillus peoriae]